MSDKTTEHDVDPVHLINLMQRKRLALLQKAEDDQPIDKEMVKLMRDISSTSLSQLKIDVEKDGNESQKEVAMAIAGAIRNQTQNPFAVERSTQESRTESKIADDDLPEDIVVHEYELSQEMGSPDYKEVMGEEA